MKTIDGKIKFLDYETYYLISNPDGIKTPLVLLHGGPGSTHNHYRMFDQLALDDDRPLIMYDQLGCGKSMIEGHPELFNEEVWLDELENLLKALKIEEMHLLGHSWGGMLALHYKFKRSGKGVKSYILSSTLYSSKVWADEQARYISLMSEEDIKAIEKAVAENKYEDEDYLRAVETFMRRHCSPKITEDYPACLRVPKIRGKEAYETAWGPNEFTPLGNQKDYDYEARLCEIDKPTLILNGQMDMSTPFINKTMYDKIPNSKWELFKDSRHVPYIEETKKYMSVLKKWLNDND